jgi:adenylylsulfate kinase
LTSAATAAAHTWWLTGLPGAGKTTLAIALCESLKANGGVCCLLDGDELRHGVNSDRGFSVEAREEHARRVAEIARLLNTNGVHAVVALISPTRKGRALAAQIIGPRSFSEIYVSTPLEVCIARDPKGLYAKAFRDPSMGLTGVHATYEFPSQPAVCIDTSKTSVSQAVEVLLRLLS